jgi:signal transduction histidine kinase
MPQSQTPTRLISPTPQGLLWLAVILALLAFYSNTTPAAHAASTNTDPPANALSDATNHLGQWIWETNTTDKQICRFWKSFEIPSDAKISTATVRITVDNGYTLYLDGREIGRGSDWRTVSEYDITRLLEPGHHVLAVDAFNDRLQAGLIFGLNIQLVNEERSSIDVVSDQTWRVVPNTERGWINRRTPQPGWHPAIVVGSLGQLPWKPWPFGLSVEPPLGPILVHFWQTGWFQLTLVSVCTVAVLFCLWLMTQLTAQSQAQRFLQIERARIARDIHDDLGARLTHLVLLGEVAQSELPADSGARAQFGQICEKARELSQAMDEIVWAVNSRRDTLRDFSTYVCKYAKYFLDSTTIRCRLDVEPDIPAAPFDLPVRRNLLQAVKEALNNAAKHSGASEVFLRIYRHNQKITVVVEDNGRGFDPEQLDYARNGMINMSQRMSEIGGHFALVSQPGNGCRVEFTVPLNHSYHGWLHRGPRTHDDMPPVPLDFVAHPPAPPIT